MDVKPYLWVLVVYYGMAAFSSYVCVFFFNDTATTEIYTLSLHDALPIFCGYTFNIMDL